MRDDLFEELLENCRQASRWLRGEEVEAVRVTFVGEPDPREVRVRLGMSADEFAAALRIAPEALRRWEQGHRDPASDAMRLLRMADDDPVGFAASIRARGDA